jgi:Gluconate 2-dehydrogenase subunit 3
MQPSTRRNTVKQLGSGLVLAQLGATAAWITPAEAARRKLPLKVLTDSEAQTLAVVASVLVPGATRAGIVPFVDQHLSLGPDQCLLMAKYLDLPQPYLPIYQEGLRALDALARKRHRAGWPALKPADRTALMTEVMAPAPPGDWDGKWPTGLIGFLLRADAVDVVYGTRQGFARLGIEHLAHIEPEPEW